MKRILLTLALLALCVGVHADKVVYCNHPAFGLSPYTWHLTTTFNTPTAEAPNPGAYIKTIVSGTTSVKLRLDTSANKATGLRTNVYIMYTVDDGPFTIYELSGADDIDEVTLAENLDKSKDHKVEVYFKSASLIGRWESSKTHLRVKALVLDDGGAIKPFPKRSKYAMIYGASGTEGVGAVSKFITWNDTSTCNAVYSYPSMLFEALDCEYGQIASGGWGIWQREMPIPPMHESWSYLWKDVSRLKNGKFSPKPDYIIIHMGGNDRRLSDNNYNIDIITPYLKILREMRAAAPDSIIFCTVSVTGAHRENIRKVVEKFNDKRVVFIDVPSVNCKVPAGESRPTSVTYDAWHPDVYGNGIIAACLTAEIQKAIDKLEK
ncbi:MAG: hypothetical protein J6332_04415 [Abditibacteriota bacterium]|nr:hypothetical protein [Abditibacteriota bacterium]